MPDAPSSPTWAVARPDRRPPRVTFGFMRQHPAHWIALGAGSGLSPAAPGTLGTLWAWACWVLLLQWLPPLWQGAVIGATLLAGWWACAVTTRHLGLDDPGAIVIDEIVAFWLILWLITPAGVLQQLIAFALFRALDATKPGPIGWADRLLHGQRGWRGAWGIMFDDLVAAFCALFAFAAWRWWQG